MLLNGNSGIGIKSKRGVTATLALLMIALLPGLAAATTINATAVSSAGEGPLSARLTIDDAITPGSLVFSIAMIGDASKIKIRGFSAGVLDGTSLSGVTVLGENVKESFLNLGQNMLGTHLVDPSCTTCDLSISFNKPVKGATDRSVHFTLSDTAGPLGLSAFQGQDFAVLLQVKGAENVKGLQHGFFFNDKKMVILEGSIVNSPIPEPTTALLLTLGLAGLSVGEKRTRALRG